LSENLWKDEDVLSFFFGWCTKRDVDDVDVGRWPVKHVVRVSVRLAKEATILLQIESELGKTIAIGGDAYSFITKNIFDFAGMHRREQMEKAITRVDAVIEKLFKFDAE